MNENVPLSTNACFGGFCNNNNHVLACHGKFFSAFSYVCKICTGWKKEKWVREAWWVYWKINKMIWVMKWKWEKMSGKGVLMIVFVIEMTKKWC